MTPPAKAKRFRVALSFPGEKRDYVRQVAEILATALSKEKVLYDEYLTAELARPDMDLYLGNLYRNESDLVVPFYCAEYSAKKWCKLEWRQMRDILLNGEGSRVMPFRFDETPIEGVLSLDGYVHIGTRTPAEAARLIFDRLGLPVAITASQEKYRTFTAKLPSVNTLLVGRDEQLTFLDEAWTNPATNFLQIIAPGGTGKTALVDKWFKRHVGEASIFGWSFYSQGASTQHATSSDAFFADILGWFKIDLPAMASVYAKANAVVERLRQERLLLILDGIEPLQDYSGILQDSALKALLKELSTEQRGLVLCTTRIRLAEISDDPPGMLSLDLENLTPKHGAEYLRRLKVTGEEDEIQQASRDCGNHALALTLLGTYLADFFEGDIRRRVEIRELMIDESKYEAQARRMMAAYERMFAGRPEAAILRALSFFDRPAEPEALKLVLPKMKELEYRVALKRLHRARLILTNDADVPVDCHPLIREHFATVMRSIAPRKFRKGHLRLYKHYYDKAPFQPETLNSMAPLFYAVYHGCQARSYVRALRVYSNRILRDDEYFLQNSLGAFGIDLSLLSHFFEVSWTKPKAIGIYSRRCQAWLLSQAGIALSAVGRLSDALDPLRCAAERRVEEEDWFNASKDYSTLSGVLLCLGYVNDACIDARRSVDFAGRSAHPFPSIMARTTLADALLASGELAEAQHLCFESERIQSEQSPKYPILYSLGGFRYCDLLLEQGQRAEVIRRAKQTLAWAEENHWLMNAGLDHLSLGCAYPVSSPESTDHLNQAVSLLRQSGYLMYLPLSLLARGTPRDLEEVFRIASRSGMRLHLTDYHLASARLALADSDRTKAREDVAQAERFINETGYHRRDRQLEQLRAELDKLTKRKTGG